MITIPFWPQIGVSNNKSDDFIDLKLHRVTEALQILGNPTLPPIIHVAGTNGKGSTISYIYSILTEAGYKSHLYTSPHLVRFNERIRVNGEEIDDQTLNKTLQECKDKVDHLNLTFFEGTTVAAILAFARNSQNTDFTLLEVGMGGRKDATNIMPNSLLSIITPISLDHTEYLGDTMEKIAFEKAGIIKDNCTTIIGKQEPSALAVIKEVARSLNSECITFNKDFNIVEHRNSFDYISSHLSPGEGGRSLGQGFSDMLNIKISLLGRHQFSNAALAIAAAKKLKEKGYNINEENIRNGLVKTIWPARLQQINNGKIRSYFQEFVELNIILDGAHNPDGIAALMNYINETKDEYEVNVMIFGMLANKDFPKSISLLKELNHIVITSIDQKETASSQEISKEFTKNNINHDSSENFADSLRVLKKYLLKNFANSSKIRLIICGSLYLAGEVLGCDR